jgi:hypothetical protein
VRRHYKPGSRGGSWVGVGERGALAAGSVCILFRRGFGCTRQATAQARPRGMNLAAGRLRCDARAGVAPPNSLLSMRSLRSHNGGRGRQALAAFALLSLGMSVH